MSRDRRTIPHAPVTPFVGRGEQLNQLTRLLRNADCRIVTVLGAGGAGKTRLALEAVPLVEHEFGDGAALINLERGAPNLSLPEVVAPELNVRLGGAAAPAEELAHALESHELLVVMDSFEGFVEESGLLATLSELAPGLKLLATSREPLRLQAEWRLPLSGLVAGDRGPGHSEAERLFNLCAQRVDNSFHPARAAAEIRELCWFVGGSPLAIELAAAWASLLSPAEILAAIRDRIDFLESRDRDRPPRHASMEAVFDQSVGRLPPDERVTFARLSVFRGGCTQDAANGIANASVNTLGDLVELSLVQRDQNGRYHMHELLREYALRRLEQEGALETTREAHCRWYSEHMHATLAGLYGNGQVEAVQQIATELDNARAAWEWAVETHNHAALSMLLYPLSIFWEIRGMYAEAARAKSRALQALSNGDGAQPLRAQLQVQLAWMHLRLGQVEIARELLAEARSAYEERGVSLVPGLGTDPNTALGVAALVKNDLASAEFHGQRAATLAEERGDALNLELALYVLEDTALERSELERAATYVDRLYDLTLNSGDEWFRGYCAMHRGDIAFAEGYRSDAASAYHEAYSIRSRFEDPEGMALALARLGDVALEDGDTEQALTRYRTALADYRRIGDRGGVARARVGLGRALATRGDGALARRHLRKALHDALEMEFVPMAVAAIAVVGELWCRDADVRGPRTLEAVLAFGSDSGEGARIARQSLRHVERRGSGTHVRVGSSIWELGNWVIAQLETTTSEPAAHETAAPYGLTHREQEVLDLLADGLSNAEIAEHLVVSMGTVKAHTSNIYAKLEVRSRTEALVKAQQAGLVDGSA